jgi:hypothetical protein
MWVKSHCVISGGKNYYYVVYASGMEEMQLFPSGKLNYYCIIIICGIEKMSLYEHRRHPCQINQREMSLPAGQVTLWVSRIVCFA